VWFAGHKADDIPQFLSQGTSIHGIETTNEEYIPFSLQGKSSLLYVHVPTEWELENCEHIPLTSDEPWDPTSEDWEENEAKFTRKHRHARSITTKGDMTAPFDVRTAATNCSTLESETYERYFADAPKLCTASYAVSRVAKSGKRKLGIDYEKLRCILGHVPMEVVEQTIIHSTQLASQNAEMLDLRGRIQC
jgi:hypothetical protein